MPKPRKMLGAADSPYIVSLMHLIETQSKATIAYVWPPPRKIKGRPGVYIVVTFGLSYKMDYPRIVEAVEPYRWVRSRYLEPSAESKLRRYRKRPKAKIKRFPGAKRVRDRGSEASGRERVGDWEMDTIVSAKGRSVARALRDSVDYMENPLKTDGGELISAYECDARTADSEFLLSKQQYASLTGREQAHHFPLART